MTCHGAYPRTRLRRTRMQGWCRELVAEHRLHPSDLIWPVFIQEGKNTETPIPSMPGVNRITLDILAKKAKTASQLGIQAIALFPVIDSKLKTPNGDEAFNPDNLVCRAIKEIKNSVPEIGIIADVALDPYTSHGQDGIVENGQIINDKTVDILCRQALVQARAGCDIVAPSDMMDGRIGAIRAVLESEGYQDTLILAYAAKYASALYGPFRDAVDSKKLLGKADKRSYQMDPANSDEALREIAMDITEGADMVMVKPGLAYLDIIHRTATAFPLPVFAYHVSGEYAMVKAAAAQGWLDGEAVMMEHLLAMKRAGARAILTYVALEIAERL
ncbi:MAG: porphobilinogen synthase [Pseudomonadota bacterium]|nr:porphobilinogen synthase [Pseudomonadota bacterium]